MKKFYSIYYLFVFSLSKLVYLELQKYTTLDAIFDTSVSPSLNYLYIATDNKKILTFDITEKEEPPLIISNITTETDVFLLMTLPNDRILVTLRNSSNSSQILDIYDISNKTDILKPIGSLTLWNCSIQSMTYLEDSNTLFLIDYLYGIIVIDISSKPNPQEIYRNVMNYTNSTWTQSKLMLDNTVLVVIGPGLLNSLSMQNISLYNITNLSNIVLIKTVFIPFYDYIPINIRAIETFENKLFYHGCIQSWKYIFKNLIFLVMFLITFQLIYQNGQLPFIVIISILIKFSNTFQTLIYLSIHFLVI